MLTKASLGNFMHGDGISVSRLGQTIQDAIEVTRRIGVSFLWVDALCICQDDDEEKAVEITRMCDIYSSSTVTIAVADAKSSTEGFLKMSGQDDDGPCIEIPFRDLPTLQDKLRLLVGRMQKIGSRLIGSKTHTSMLWPGGQHANLTLYPIRDRVYDVGDLRKRYEDFPLNTRAWTLQENLLSPRVLFYTRHELLMINYQDYMRPVLPSMFDYVGPGVEESDREIWNKLLELVMRKEDFATMWMRLVRKYTQRHMTYEKDRLAALRGLITAIEVQSGQRSLYGMWEDSLIRTMAWATSALSVNRAHRTPLQVPSWSWVSVRSEVIWYDINIDEVAIKLDSILENGVLVIEAMLIPESEKHDYAPWKWELGSKRYFADISSNGDENATGEIFWMLLSWSSVNRKAVHLSVVRKTDAEFVRTGLLVSHWRGDNEDCRKRDFCQMECIRLA